MVHHSEPRRKVSPRDPTQEWWIPQTPPEEIADDQRMESLNTFYAIAKTCIEDEVDQDVFDTLFIANLSLRVAATMTGIPKTTMARRRDLLKIRIADLVAGDRNLMTDLLIASSINE